MMGVFLSFEGGEGTGKTTQLQLLARHIEALGAQTAITREPGGSRLGAKVRELLVQHTDDPPTPLAELFLYAADRAHHVASVIRPALDAGRIVLCDRYADATVAYQGWGRGTPLEVIEVVNGLATEGVWPHRTVILDLPPRLGVERSLAGQRARKGPREERFEGEPLAFHERVRAGYRNVAEADPNRVRLVDAAGQPGEVFDRVWSVVGDLFERR
jgi:dTMP kinase